LDTTKTPPVFERVLRALGNWKIGSQGSQKAPEFEFGIYKNEFGEKLFFSIHSMRKPRIRMPKTLNVDTEINQKTFWDQASSKNLPVSVLAQVSHNSDAVAPNSHFSSIHGEERKHTSWQPSGGIPLCLITQDT
jgi:hypothetical protein